MAFEISIIIYGLAALFITPLLTSAGVHSKNCATPCVQEEPEAVRVGGDSGRGEQSSTLEPKWGCIWFTCKREEALT